MNYTNHTNNTSSSFDTNAVLNAIKKIQPCSNMLVDLFIMTREMETMLREHIPVSTQTIDRFDTFCGISFEVYDTLVEAIVRTLELRDLGKRVRLITMEKE